MSDTIVEVGGKKYREVKRVAKVGELIKVTRGDRKYHHKNDIGHVIKDEGDNTVRVDFNGHDNAHTHENGIWWIGNTPGSVIGEYVVLEPVESLTVEQRLSALEAEFDRLHFEVGANTHAVSAVKKLARRVEKLELRLADSETAKHDDGVVSDGAVHKSPWTREEVVEYAKHDMARLKDQWFDVRFVEDRRKGRVTALLLNPSRDIMCVGRSRVSKSDCFNIHIGRVIALRRALYDEVSDYYTNAPQPTKVQRGDIVEYNGETYKIDNRKEWLPEHAHKDSQVGRYGRIIDDSHDFGGDDK